MRVGIYARVSTLIGQSPEMQLTELREYASRRGWEIFSEYVDSGISGSKESRPELNRLMSDAHQRKIITSSVQSRHLEYCLEQVPDEDYQRASSIAWDVPCMLSCRELQ